MGKDCCLICGKDVSDLGVQVCDTCMEKCRQASTTNRIADNMNMYDELDTFEIRALRTENKELHKENDLLKTKFFESEDRNRSLQNWIERLMTYIDSTSEIPKKDNEKDKYSKIPLCHELDRFISHLLG